MSVEPIIAKILAAHPRIGLELQWELEGDDYDTRWMLELHVIVELAGPEHARYSTIALHRFPGEAIEERRDAHRIASEIAERVRLPLHSVDIEQVGGQGDSGWIRRQPKAETTFEVAWDVSWWSDDAEPCSESGVEVVPAISGKEARFAVSRMLDARYRYNPVSTVIRVGVENDTHNVVRGYDGPPIEMIRDVARAGPLRASRIAHAIVEWDPTITPLALGIAMARAFGHSFPFANRRSGAEPFLMVPRWRKGEVDDAALDAALEQRIEVNRPNWDRPRRLREAFAARTLAAFIREDWPESRMALLRDLQSIFDIDLSDAQYLIERVLDGKETAPEHQLALRP